MIFRILLADDCAAIVEENCILFDISKMLSNIFICFGEKFLLNL